MMAAIPPIKAMAGLLMEAAPVKVATGATDVPAGTDCQDTAEATEEAETTAGAAEEATGATGEVAGVAAEETGATGVVAVVAGAAGEDAGAEEADAEDHTPHVVDDDAD